VVGHRSAAALALALALAAAARAERLPFRVYSTADGLAGDAVRVLLRDSRGFLWVGTSSGLSRFDGHAFRTYDMAQGLPSTRIEALAETADGAVWVGTADGLARLTVDAAAGARPFVGVSLPAVAAPDVTCLFADGAGRLWICAGSEGVLVVDDPARAPQRARRIALPAGVQGAGEAVAGRDGEIWLAGDLGLVRIDPVRIDAGGGAAALWPVRAPAVNITALNTDEQGRVWVGVGDACYVFAPPPAGTALPSLPLAKLARAPRVAGELPVRPGEALVYDPRAGLSNAFVYAIARDGGGGMWLGTGGGLVHFAGGAPRSIGAREGLPENAVTDVVAAADGTVWAATESRGLARLTPAKMISYGVDDGLENDRVTSFVEDGQELYAVAFSRYLQRFDGGRFTDVTPRVVLREAIAGWGWNQFFLRDRRGRWWVPTARGLFAFAPVRSSAELVDARPIARYRTTDGMPGEDIFRLFEDRRGDLWVSVIGGSSLVRLRGGERLERVREVEGLPRGAPTAFGEDAAGNLWIGFYLGGLARVRFTAGGEEWSFFDGPQGVPPGMIADLYRDRNEALWLAAASGGIARIDEPESAAPRFARISTAEGLSTDSARCLVEDGRGRLYVGTSRGIDRVDPRGGRIVHLGAADGLPNSVVWACHAGRDGSLWFGTLHGVARLDPTREAAARTPRVLISAVRARGVPLPLPELGAAHVGGWRLASDQDTLEIEYVALGGDDQVANQVQFEHRFAGSGEGWSAPTTTRTLVLPRLAPGSYRLLVRALTHDGGRSSAATASFDLLPPFWRRPWFLALAAVAAAAIVWTASRLRLRRQLALERMRTRIAADLHDDVGASLARIGLLGELAGDRLGGAPEEARTMLAQIAAEARELTEATADMVWAVDPRRDDLGSLVVRLRRFAGDLLESRGIVLHVETPADAEATPLAPEVRRALHLALKEALHNVAKHAQAREVWLRIEHDETAVRAEVRDDGRGIAPELAAAAAAAGRRGLASLESRAREAGGSVEVDGAAGRGTSVRVSLPLTGRRRRRVA